MATLRIIPPLRVWVGKSHYAQTKPTLNITINGIILDLTIYLLKTISGLCVSHVYLNQIARGFGLRESFALWIHAQQGMWTNYTQYEAISRTINMSNKQTAASPHRVRVWVFVNPSLLHLGLEDVKPHGLVRALAAWPKFTYFTPSIYTESTQTRNEFCGPFASI